MTVVADRDVACKVCGQTIPAGVRWAAVEGIGFAHLDRCPSTWTPVVLPGGSEPTRAPSGNAPPEQLALRFGAHLVAVVDETPTRTDPTDGRWSRRHPKETP
jgi:hypothetical protein